MITGLFKVIGDIGGRWLDNKKEISKAKADLAVAELTAKKDLAVKKLSIEYRQLEETGALDQMAVKQQAKSWFDEIFACVIMAPAGLSVYGACVGAPYEMWGYMILQTLHYMPEWYLGMLFLLFVNYFGFRSLLRVFLKAAGNKIVPFFKRGRNETDTNKS